VPSRPLRSRCTRAAGRGNQGIHVRRLEKANPHRRRPWPNQTMSMNAGVRRKHRQPGQSPGREAPRRTRPPRIPAETGRIDVLDRSNDGHPSWPGVMKKAGLDLRPAKNVLEVRMAGRKRSQALDRKRTDRRWRLDRAKIGLRNRLRKPVDRQNGPENSLSAGISAQPSRTAEAKINRYRPRPRVMGGTSMPELKGRRAAGRISAPGNIESMRCSRWYAAMSSDRPESPNAKGNVDGPNSQGKPRPYREDGQAIREDTA